jgi:hypothetical protein
VKNRLALATGAVAVVAGGIAFAMTSQPEAGLVVAVIVVALVIAGRGVGQVVQTLRAASSPTTRPQFAKAYPRSPELDRLVAAFIAGNFALVRRDAPLLAEKAEDGTVRAAAQDLRRRIAPDPTAIYLLGLGLALAVAVSAYYLMQPR